MTDPATKWRSLTEPQRAALRAMGSGGSLGRGQRQACVQLVRKGLAVASIHKVRAGWVIGYSPSDAGRALLICDEPKG